MGGGACMCTGAQAGMLPPPAYFHSLVVWSVYQEKE